MNSALVVSSRARYDKNLLMKTTLATFCLSLMMVSVSALANNQDQLFILIGERLALMDEVAAYKWHRQLDIEDKGREKTVLDQAARTAMQAGITEDSSRTFFSAQIEAAKEIQRYWFATWCETDHEEPPRAPDLDGVIRPKLIELGDRIIAAISSAGPLDDSTELRQQFYHAVNITGFSKQSQDQLYNALMEVAFYDNRLDRILATGELRVGTTGDYAPFSIVHENSFKGIDIDLARDLAASMNVKPVFVHTSWPTLMRDLADNRFDVGMSGISRTLARQKIAYFSRPYHTGGKTPISRCEDARRFDSLNKIDRPQVRVIVNPGGTNQAFVDSRLDHASVTVFEDNRTIFDEILAGRADVMITDAIEVKLKAAEHSALCATMPEETFTYQEKAYLMPRDITLKEYVNTWLSLRLGDGTVEETFKKHLNTTTLP